MRKSICLFLISLLLTCVTNLWSQTASAPSGSGTSEDPYQIATWQNLYWLSQNSSEWSKSFKQTADIDFSSASPAINTWDGGGGWTPIGIASPYFSGTYDGDGKTISNLYINRSGTNLQGFFSYVSSGSCIQNLSLVNCNIKGRDVVGGLIAGIYHASSNMSVIVSNCHVSGTVTGTYERTGGLIGKIEVYSNATGGDTYNIFIDNCSAEITINAVGNVGGLIGLCQGYSSTQNPRINTCYSSGTVTSNGSAGNMGGLIGALGNSRVYNCYSIVNVTGNTGDDAGGGFTGSTGSGAIISYCYSTGYVSGFGGGDEYGFIGYYNTSYPPTISDCFWNNESSGQTTSGAPSGVTGKTTAEMKTLSTFTNAGWDFVGEMTNGSNDYWDMDYSQTINNGYPYLSWQDGEDQSLPVELISFKAECRNGTILLTWMTESEFENLGFIIERRSQASDWMEIVSYLSDDMLCGHGSTSEKHEYSYIDASVALCETYCYRIADVDYSGNVTKQKEVEITTEIENVQIPAKFGLQSAYPNPFNPSVIIPFELTEDGHVSLSAYNLRGQVVEKLINAYTLSGSYSYTWVPQNLSAGVYIIRLQLDQYTSMQKVILVK